MEARRNRCSGQCMWFYSFDKKKGAEVNEKVTFWQLAVKAAVSGLHFNAKIDKTWLCDGNRIQLWDTAGQERFRKSMVQHYYRNVHAVVFVYDMTNIASFHSLPSWIEECKQHLLANDIPRILVGNKCDLRSAIQVPTDLAQKFADTHSMPLFETSAKNPNDNDHVEAIFMTLAHKLKSHKPLMLSQPPDRNEIYIKPEPKPAMICWC
ncbi:ras-related protein Rab-33B [Egretta garzetta]|uniref:ras-related protein Rab-33B n=1 Tax=Egretta garzetta TaxID=188379 RepID=UPI00163C25B7|nr:ras-related protein Rab-33B [Egretta garzetta]